MATSVRDWTPFAVVLIDVQQDFWPEATAKAFPDFPANVERLLEMCRSEGLEVIHLRAAFQPDMSDWFPLYKLRGWSPCILGTEGVEVLPFAKEQPGELVIHKQAYDGFRVPALMDHLARGGKRLLFLGGLITSVCVFLTTASAAQRGYLTAIVEDCSADSIVRHAETLDGYGFIFERTRVDQIVANYDHWQGMLRELDQMEARPV